MGLTSYEPLGCRGEAYLCPDVQCPTCACPQEASEGVRNDPDSFALSTIGPWPPPPGGPPRWLLRAPPPRDSPPPVSPPCSCLPAQGARPHITSPASTCQRLPGPLRTKSKPFNRTCTAILGDMTLVCFSSLLSHHHVPVTTSHTHRDRNTQRYTHTTHTHTPQRQYTYKHTHTHTTQHTYTQTHHTNSMHTPHTQPCYFSPSHSAVIPLPQGTFPEQTSPKLPPTCARNALQESGSCSEHPTGIVSPDSHSSPVRRRFWLFPFCREGN